MLDAIRLIDDEHLQAVFRPLPDEYFTGPLYEGPRRESRIKGARQRESVERMVFHLHWQGLIAIILGEGPFAIPRGNAGHTVKTAEGEGE